MGVDDSARRAMGSRLREFRRSLGLTQDGLADKLKKKRQTISAWETGASAPDSENWLALGQLGMSLDYVVLGIRTVPVSQYAARVYRALKVLDMPPAGGVSGTRSRLPTP